MDNIPPKTASSFLNQLRGPQDQASSGLESGGGGVDLSPNRRRASRDALLDVIRRNAEASAGATVDRDEIDSFARQADEVLKKLADDGPEALLTTREEYMLEAVIKTDGSRPSIPVIGDRIDPSDPRLGQWTGQASNFHRQINRAARATGRVIENGSLDESNVLGTAWMIAPGLAVTAKHVVEDSFERLSDGTWSPRYGKTLELDFHVESGATPNPAARILIKRAVWASSDQINSTLNLANLDVAVLELAKDGPPPAQLAATLSFPPGDAFVHVIGHPFRPLTFDGTVDEEFRRLRDLIFGSGFGIKRWAPGIILKGPGTDPRDVNRHVMTHDATTLGGSSGSGVFDFTSFGDLAVGLHYAGTYQTENYAHPTEAMKPHLSPLKPGHTMFV